MADAAERYMTVAEFLDWDDGTDTRYELVHGRVLAMAPPSMAHATIVPNLAAAIRPKLKPPCYVAAEPGIMIDEHTYYQADLAVSCTRTRADEQRIVQPLLIVEVLSPSTASHDRGNKLPNYRRLPSVQEIVLVSSQERRVELWRRIQEKWEVSDLIGDAVLGLASIGTELALGTVYEGVDLEPLSPSAE